MRSKCLIRKRWTVYETCNTVCEMQKNTLAKELKDVDCYECMKTGKCDRRVKTFERSSYQCFETSRR